MLDDLGLVAALEWQAREVSRRGQMEVDVQSEDISEDLPDEYKTCIYRLVQEALNNAARHASARSARVTARQTAEKIIVVIKDDGSGFDFKKSRGMGILGMHERVKRLGGTLTIESQPGGGTVLTAELPVNFGRQ
jgi:signal transduction histidine kinase